MGILDTVDRYDNIATFEMIVKKVVADRFSIVETESRWDLWRLITLQYGCRECENHLVVYTLVVWDWTNDEENIRVSRLICGKPILAEQLSILLSSRTSTRDSATYLLYNWIESSCYSKIKGGKRAFPCLAIWLALVICWYPNTQHRLFLDTAYTDTHSVTYFPSLNMFIQIQGKLLIMKLHAKNRHSVLRSVQTVRFNVQCLVSVPNRIDRSELQFISTPLFPFHYRFQLFNGSIEFIG